MAYIPVSIMLMFVYGLGLFSNLANALYRYQVDVGQQINVSCIINDAVTQGPIWYYKDDEIKALKDCKGCNKWVTLEENPPKAILTLTPYLQQDFGKYTCTASNAVINGTEMEVDIVRDAVAADKTPKCILAQKLAADPRPPKSHSPMCDVNKEFFMVQCKDNSKKQNCWCVDTDTGRKISAVSKNIKDLPCLYSRPYVLDALFIVGALVAFLIMFDLVLYKMKAFGIFHAVLQKRNEYFPVPTEAH